MRKSINLTLYPFMLMIISGCENDTPPPYDTGFPIPRTVHFADTLSEVGLFESPLNTLRPQSGVFLYELNSELFTDFAVKQRFMKLPEGQMTQVDEDWNLVYPEGTILAKTFSYPFDFRDLSKGLVHLETRLLILDSGQWNMATYRWNEEQTEAVLMLDGETVPVSWTDADGRIRSTQYGVPHEGECVTCHQRNGNTRFIGPTVDNLNRLVSREDEQVHQLAFFVEQGVLEAGQWKEAPRLADFMNSNLSIEQRGRAYLHINCAHCHQPEAWSVPAEEGLDFRYDTPLAATGIQQNRGEILQLFESGEMPYLGTTLVPDDGVELLHSFLNAL